LTPFPPPLHPFTTSPLGTWQIPKSEAADATYNAIKLGYRHLDLAYIYGNNIEVGQGIKRALDEGLIESRKDLWITSKIWNDQHTDVEGAVNGILKDLGIEYLNLLLIHWPISFIKGQAPPSFHTDFSLGDVYQKMEKLCPTKALALGISNFSIEEVQSILDIATIKPIVNQVESSIYWNQFELESFCAKNGITITSYSPLCQNHPDPSLNIEFKDLTQDPLVLEIAKAHNTTPHAVCLRWHLDLTPKRVVLVKSVQAERIQRNFVDTLSFSLTEEEMNKLNNIDTQFRSLNPMGWRSAGTPFFPNY
jgi:diketogulonate reductase-like aldo/keto reductase